MQDPQALREQMGTQALRGKPGLEVMRDRKGMLERREIMEHREAQVLLV
jgi:hypothetical protein